MSVEHLSIRGGGAEFVPFARGRIKALKAAGLKYASRTYVVNGVNVKVRLVGDFEYIDVQGGIVAVLYESYDHYATGEFFEVPYDEVTGLYEVQIDITKVYLVFPNGSRTYLGDALYEWTPYGDNTYGYDGVTPLTALPPEPPAIAPDPPLTFKEPVRNEGVPLRIVSFSSATEHAAMYATQSNADSMTNPTEIDHTQTLLDDTQTVLADPYTIHWAVRPIRAPLKEVVA